MAIEIKDEAWASELQREVTRYMDALYDNAWNEDHGGEPIMYTKTGIPFCGECDNCHYREVLAYAAELIIDGYKQGKIDTV